MAVSGVATTAIVGVYDTANNAWKTGDAGNLTLKIVADGTQGSIAGTPAEIDATNQPGRYKVAITGAENTGTSMEVSGKTATADCIVTPDKWDNLDATIASRGTADPGDEMDLVDAPNTTAVAAIQDGLSTFDATSDTVDVGKISGDSDAADALELQYDGTGLLGDTYPLRQDQAPHSIVTGAAGNTVAESFTLTTGSETGTYANTVGQDATYHQIEDDSGTIDCYYQFDIGTGTPVQVSLFGRMTGLNDDITVYGYDWVADDWVSVHVLQGIATMTDASNAFPLLTTMVGTGANEGVVRVRFAATGLSSAALYVDQLLLSFAPAAFDAATDEVDVGKVKGVAVAGVDDFKADVSGLALTGEAAAAAAGLSTFDASSDTVDVGAVSGTSVTGPDDLKADVSSLALEATLTAMKGAGWTNETLVAILTAAEAATAPTVEEIDTELSANHGAGAWTDAGGGSGANTVTVTVQTAGATVFEGVKVTADNQTETLATPYVVYTDENGEAVFYLDNGDWRFIAAANGAQAGGATNQAINEAEAVTVTVTASTVPAPADPDNYLLYGYARKLEADAAFGSAGLTVKVINVDPDGQTDATANATRHIMGTSYSTDANGLWSFEIAKVLDDSRLRLRFTWTDAASVEQTEDWEAEIDSSKANVSDQIAWADLSPQLKN